MDKKEVILKLRNQPISLREYLLAGAAPAMGLLRTMPGAQSGSWWPPGRFMVGLFFVRGDVRPYGDGHVAVFEGAHRHDLA